MVTMTQVRRAARADSGAKDLLAVRTHRLALPGLTVADDPKAATVWAIEDRYGDAKATRIFAEDGSPTKFAMVYGKTPKGWHWQRAVSDRYQPIPTGPVVDIIKGAIDLPVLTEQVSFDRHNTRVRVRVVLDHDPVKVAQQPFDLASRWTSHAMPDLAKGRPDLIYPVVQITNSYDASSSISIRTGLWRLVCSNGAMVEAFAGSSFKSVSIHTVHEIDKLLDAVKSARFDMALVGERVKAMVKRKLDEAGRESLAKMLTTNYRVEFAEHMALGGNTAYSALAYATYLQTHRVTVSRGRAVQPLVEALWKMAA